MDDERSWEPDNGPATPAHAREVPFDRSVLKVGQAILISGLLIGYVIAFRTPGAAIALPLLGLMMFGSAAGPRTALPRYIYVGVLRPRHWLKPRIVVEDPAPHRFALLVGALFLAAASVAAVFGADVAAWTLAWIVVALASLNFAFDICVGCIVYAQLTRAGLLPLRGART